MCRGVGGFGGARGGEGHRPSQCTKYRNPRVSGETIKSPFFFFALPTPADEADVEGKAFVPRAACEETWAEFKTTLE